MSLTDSSSVLAGILRQRILILDGAMGTMVQRHGLAEADYRGRTHFEELPYPQADQFRVWRDAAAAVDSAEIAAGCARPAMIGPAIARVRLRAIKAASRAVECAPPAGVPLLNLR